MIKFLQSTEFSRQKITIDGEKRAVNSLEVLNTLAIAKSKFDQDTNNLKFRRIIDYVKLR